MEFFEQAHVAKGPEYSKKDSKSEETMKKQLKQMLYGYRNSDNEVIKNSLDIKVNSADSSSVSGFSDLNLTESSGAGDTTRATIGSPDDVDSVLDDLNANISPKITDLSLDADKEEEINESSISEVSSYCEESFFDTSRSSESASLLGKEEDEELLDICSIKSLADSQSSQEFDPDGMLASKIHDKLKTRIPKHVTKRKIETGEFNRDDAVGQKIKPIHKSKKNKHTNGPQILHPRLLEEDSMSSEISLNKCISQNSIIKLPHSSPPYITMNAAKIQQESFSDILGKYKHSVIKNVPCDNNELILSENAPSFYSYEKGMIVDDKDVDEEITYLSEEDLTSTNDNIECLDIQARNIELSQGSTKNIDNSIQSETSMELSNKYLEDSIKIHFKGNLCVCVMKHPAKLYVNGKFKAQCLAGTVKIFGHTLTQQKSEIYAPYSNFAQCLSTIEKDNNFYGLFGKLTTLGMTVLDAESIVTTVGSSDAVLMIEPLKSAKMTFIEQHFSIANLFNKSNKDVDYCHAKALERLECSIYTSQPRKVFEVPISWQEINKYCFEQQSRGIFCGGKGVGKSTCLRYHVNRLLANGPVLVIDLDIGQSEFTVAGNISANVVNEPLLGPNFTHLRRPERTLNLGMINALDDMRRYVNAVVKLIAYCSSDERLREMRWIVNTMGLCNVVGLHIITIIILHCQPTYLLQIDSKNVKKRFDIYLRPQLVSSHYAYHKNMTLFSNTMCPDNLNYAFVLSHHTESPVRNNNSLAPRDERYLNFLAYFSELLQIYRVSSLLEITPYEVQLQDLCVYMNVKIPEGTVQQVLNGKIVALCQHEPGSVTKKTYFLADEPLLCHGHGLIRGIDFEKGILYVITPMSFEDLSLVDTLLYADWVPELRGQESHIPAAVTVPYRMPTMYQQKQLMFTPRRRFNPIQLLKMSKGS